MIFSRLHIPEIKYSVKEANKVPIERLEIHIYEIILLKIFLYYSKRWFLVPDELIALLGRLSLSSERLEM